MENTVKLLKSEGIRGPHDLIFLTRYAYFTDDNSLMNLVGNTLEDSQFPESPWLLYALCEYYEATGKEFAATAADFLCSRCDDMLSRNKAARVLMKDEYLTRGEEPLGLIELYRATYSEEFLNQAIDKADNILEHIHENFSIEDVYDISSPSGSSKRAVLFDILARITQEAKWVEAAKKQKHFVKMLSEKYPTYCSFGLLSLLADEFSWKTVVCGKSIPKALLTFYAPTTEILLNRNLEKGVYIKENGTLSSIGSI